jgi:crotonobetainyl-CoA hydratase
VPAAQLMERARSLAKQIMELSPMSVRASKQAVYRGLNEASIDAALKNQNTYPAVAAMYKSDDLREGPKAFAEKRAPQWKGK